MKYINEFINFLNESKSPFQVVRTSIEMLDKEGFQELDFSEPWELQHGGKYYVNLYDTTLFAFRVGNEPAEEMILRLAAAHTDVPAFRIKPNPEMKEKGYLKLNTECYGSPILSSWFDRPLSIAGKVALKSDRRFEPKEVLIDLEKPLLVIPNLAIHLNREVNDGVKINKQQDVLPLLATLEEQTEATILSLLARQLQIPETDILDYDLFIYNMAQACTVGINQDFIVGPRIDDLSSVYGLLQGIISEGCSQDLCMICLLDNEEIGNETKQGAASQFISVLLEKILQSLGMGRMALYEILQRSMMLSVDVAQGYHPNYSGKYDPTNIAQLNKGVAFKIDTNQRYAYDTGAIAILQQLCDEHEIPYQKLTNRSDAPVGRTMGPTISVQLPARTVDIGVPLLAMHSSAETMGSKDLEALVQLMQMFFSAKR